MILLALYKKTSPNAELIDKLIAFGTRSIYSHSEIIHIDEVTKEATQISVSPRDSRVRKKPHNIDLETWDYFFAENINEAKVLQYCESKLGTKYDWVALAGFICRLKVNSKNRVFCSEFSTEALIAGGIHLFNFSKPYMVSPAMQGDNPMLKPVKHLYISCGLVHWEL
jgi:hypothetical protein